MRPVKSLLVAKANHWYTVSNRVSWLLRPPPLSPLQIPVHVRDENPHNNAPQNFKGALNRKNPLLPLLPSSQTGLNRRKHLGNDRGPSLAHRGCKAHVMAAQQRGAGLEGGEKIGDAGAHFVKGVEDAVE